MQVLLVDSSLLILQRLEELLSDTVSYLSMHSADSYQEAWQSFILKKPGLVVLDINLPQSESYLLLKKIKEAAPSTIVMILSIHMDACLQQQCFKLGADFFFDKYNEFEKIPGIINEFSYRIQAS